MARLMLSVLQARRAMDVSSLFLLWALVVFAVEAQRKTYVDVTTRFGRVRGYRDRALGRHVDVFLGIPFARPPVGSLRFRRPVRAPSWSGRLDATRAPASCEQAVDTQFGGFAGVSMWNPNTALSEDCLYLNVWAPARPSAAKRAVMVWIYGGGFNSGSATLDAYDGRTLATQGDVVVVSMQYRLGALGFLFFGSDDAPGNMGLLDQQMALRWVHAAIDVFGGDRDRVTIFGESAGAASASLHLLSPTSRLLVRRAIMQSSSALSPWAVDTVATAKAHSAALAKRVGCDVDAAGSLSDTMTCLRAVPAARFNSDIWQIGDNSYILTPFAPTIDGHFLLEQPRVTMQRDGFKKTAILLGVNQDEGTYFLVYAMPEIFTLQINRTLTAAEYMRSLRAVVPHASLNEPLIDSIYFEYGVPYEHTSQAVRYRDVMDDVLGDAAFICPVVDFTQAYAARGLSVYLYRFVHRTSANPWPRWMGVMHGYEIDHVFGAPLNRTLGYTAEEETLSRRMVTYWTNFAKTG